MSDKELPKSAGLYGCDAAIGKKGLNLAVIMLLGKDDFAVGDMNGTNDTILNNLALDQNNAKRLLKYIMDEPKITQKELQKRMDLSIQTIKQMMTELQSTGILVRVGNNRSGHWEIKSTRTEEM